MTATATPIEALLEQESWARRLARDLARGDGAMADDLVQGAYAAALTSPPSPAVPVRRWLAKVMRNLARNDRRSHANRAAVERRYAQEKRQEEAAAHAAAVLEIRRQLQKLVEELPEPYRTRVIERYVEGLKPSQITSRAGASVETVKSQLVRGRAMLRDALDRQSGGDRSKWMAAFAPLLRDRRGIATPLHAHGVVVGLVASASVVAGVFVAMHLLSSSQGAQGSAAADAGPAATVADGTPVRGEHRVAGLRRPVDIGPTEAAEGETEAALTDAPSTATTTTLWEVRDGNRRRGVAWNEDGTELAVVNYAAQQVEIWSADGRMTASSKSLLHLSEIAMLNGTIWATHPGGELARLDVETLEWRPSLKVDDPGGHWLTNGLGVDRFGRIHAARGGDGTVQVFDPRDGSRIGQWTGVPDESQVLVINSQSFALGGNRVGAAVVAIGTGYAEDLGSFHHRPVIRLNGQLADLQFLADGSLVCLVEAEGLLRFAASRDDVGQWHLVGFMRLPETEPLDAENSVERFDFGGSTGQILAFGRTNGVTVQVAREWESSGDAFDVALNVIVRTE